MMLIFDILHHLFDEQCSSDRWNHQLRSNFQANGKSWPTLISCLWDQRKWRYPLRFSLFYSVSPNYLVLMLANKGQRMICTSYRHSFKLHYCFSTYSFFLASQVDDFLIKLGIKPRLHILIISVFSLIYVIVRPTKTMNNLLKVCKICTFKVIFWHKKSTESFWFFFWRIFD